MHRRNELGWTLGLRSLGNWTRLDFPDFRRVLGNGAVAGELPGAGDIQNGLACPGVGVAIQVAQPLVRFEIRFQICQVQVVVPVLEESIEQWSKDAWLLGTEVVRGNKVQGLAGLGFVFVVPSRIRSEE